MTPRQIRARLAELARKPKGYEWTAEDYQVAAEAYELADQATKDLALGILRGEIGVAISISVPR